MLPVSTSVDNPVGILLQIRFDLIEVIDDKGFSRLEEWSWCMPYLDYNPTLSALYVLNL